MESEISKRVNNLLTVNYHQDGVLLLSQHPTYTHQLFDNELLKLDEQSTDIKINFTVSVTDLQSSLRIENASEELISQVTNQISPLLSPDTFTDIFQNFIPDKIFSDSSHEIFELYLLTHKDLGANDLLQRAEKLAMWYIETASTIDFTDDKWEVLFLIKKDPLTNNRTFIGYATLYTFHNPFRGSKLRICQVLILPPFHSKGYGRQMLLHIYSIAQSRLEVTEITVEDPAEAFQNLRDVVDVEWFLLHPPNDLKLIPSQLYFVQNALEFHHLQSPLSDEKRKNKTIHMAVTDNATEDNTGTELKKRPFDTIGVTADDDGDDEEAKKEEVQQQLKEFRLRNKRYLLKQNGDLKGLEKSLMQRELGELYDHLEGRFQRVHRRTALWLLETKRQGN
jgi:ribosomal protein S18 acetylase RimI-like enzyme